MIPKVIKWIKKIEFEVIVDHDGDPDTEEDRSEIYRKAIQIAMEKRSLVTWLAEEMSSIQDIIPDRSRWINRME